MNRSAHAPCIGPQLNLPIQFNPELAYETSYKYVKYSDNYAFVCKQKVCG
jgi:hypothetical protein